MDPVFCKTIIKVLFTLLSPFPCDSPCMTNAATDPGMKCRLGESLYKFSCNNTVIASMDKIAAPVILGQSCKAFTGIQIPCCCGGWLQWELCVLLPGLSLLWHLREIKHGSVSFCKRSWPGQILWAGSQFLQLIWDIAQKCDILRHAAVFLFFQCPISLRGLLDTDAWGCLGEIIQPSLFQMRVIYY